MKTFEILETFLTLMAKIVALYSNLLYILKRADSIVSKNKKTVNSFKHAEIFEYKVKILSLQLYLILTLVESNESAVFEATIYPVSIGDTTTRTEKFRLPSDIQKTY